MTQNTQLKTVGFRELTKDERISIQGGWGIGSLVKKTWHYTQTTAKVVGTVLAIIAALTASQKR